MNLCSTLLKLTFIKSHKYWKAATRTNTNIHTQKYSSAIKRNSRTDFSFLLVCVNKLWTGWSKIKSTDHIFYKIKKLCIISVTLQPMLQAAHSQFKLSSIATFLFGLWKLFQCKSHVPMFPLSDSEILLLLTDGQWHHVEAPQRETSPKSFHWQPHKRSWQAKHGV